MARTNSAAAEAVQTGEGGEERIGGKVLDLVVDSTQVNQVHYAAVAGREAADDYRGEGSDADQAEGEGLEAKITRHGSGVRLQIKTAEPRRQRGAEGRALSFTFALGAG